jgi:hypothetical protein
MQGRWRTRGACATGRLPDPEVPLPSAPARQQSPIAGRPERRLAQDPEDSGPRLLLAPRPPLDFGDCQMCLDNPASVIIGGVPCCHGCQDRYEIERPSAGPAD